MANGQTKALVEAVASTPPSTGTAIMASTDALVAAGPTAGAAEPVAQPTRFTGMKAAPTGAGLVDLVLAEGDEPFLQDALVSDWAIARS